MPILAVELPNKIRAKYGQRGGKKQTARVKKPAWTVLSLTFMGFNQYTINRGRTRQQFGICDMGEMDNNEQLSTKKTWSKPALKTWTKPAIRDQSIHSLTEGKPNQHSTEASPGTGS
ncbi:hypothetical protein [Ferrovibrio sp.]|uniref:hypothetical protein n=1 Tax=Ferrovibrio sp. TaxID=1917215 RepID=UPI001B7895A4|nr:hypothetical protein [Ferrovibrio sp.]MBP7064618.1 hypothetical protein [Ferrovibrio sp.]